jgi:hypothetical protein
MIRAQHGPGEGPEEGVMPAGDGTRFTAVDITPWGSEKSGARRRQDLSDPTLDVQV